MTHCPLYIFAKKDVSVRPFYVSLDKQFSSGFRRFDVGEMTNVR